MRFDKRALIGSVLLSSALILPAAPGYSFSLSKMLGNGSEDQNLDTFKLIHIGDLKAMITSSKSPVHLYDANVDTTREKYGIIPGARLLDSADNYDLSVLPPDKDAPLVFYCANTH
jgi:hypothetical protein